MRCSTCSLHGKPSPQKDDAAGVIEKMVAADVIDNLMGFLDCLDKDRASIKNTLIK